MKYILFIVLLIAGRMGALAQDAPDSLLTKAEGYFETIRQVCATREAGLWGKELAGPVLLVDPGSRKVYANMPDKEGNLKGAGTVYTGQLPLTVNFANTATEWAGIRWTMLLLPLPAAHDEQVKLMAHELFHRIQVGLGFPVSSPISEHLDTENGRIYFRLELKALQAALRAPVAKRRHHLEQAILFRKWRYELFPAAREAEVGLEMNEGLAEFTGVYVSGIAAKDTGYLPGLVEHATTSFPSFTRSFAYLTGPLYGMLLSQKQAGWNRMLKPGDDFAQLLVNVYKLHIPATIQAAPMDVKQAYGEAFIRQEESAREQERLAKEKVYLAKLVEGPLLELVLSKNMRFSFNPSKLFPLGSYGTVYPTITMTDDWGRVVVTGEALMKNWRNLFVALPTGTDRTTKTIQTAEWTLTLAEGWEVVPGERARDFKVRKK
jgi:hypothetical protein